FHRTMRRARTKGETKPYPLKRPLQNGFLGCRVPFRHKYSRRGRCFGTADPVKFPGGETKNGCPKAAPDLFVSKGRAGSFRRRQLRRLRNLRGGRLGCGLLFALL